VYAVCKLAWHEAVTDIAGPPTDQGAYITGKAFIPFYFGSEFGIALSLVYKGEGRLNLRGGLPRQLQRRKT